MTLIDRYLARTIATPLFGTLLIAAMLLVLDKMRRLFDYVINAGGPASVVWKMLANLLPEYFALGIPIGLMLGILLAFRKLATTSELDSLRGVGFGYGKLLKVPYMFTAALMLLNVAIVGWLQPFSEYRYERLRFDLTSGALGASIKVGEFNNFGSRMTLRIDKSEMHGTKLSGIFVSARDGDNRITATARQGRFLATDDPETIIFRLHNGRLVQENPKYKLPRTLVFDGYDLPIKLPATEGFRLRGSDTDESTLLEVFDRAYGAGRSQVSPKENLAFRSNLHFRLVEVAMMALLPLLAVALAVPPKRSTSSLGIFLSIVMVVTYHKINQWAQGAGSQGRIMPELALWIPFLLFACLIGWMYHVLAHRPGGQPIGGLESFFGKVGKTVRRLMPDPRAAALKRRREAEALAQAAREGDARGGAVL